MKPVKGKLTSPPPSSPPAHRSYKSSSSSEDEEEKDLETETAYETDEPQSPPSLPPLAPQVVLIPPSAPKKERKGKTMTKTSAKRKLFMEESELEGPGALQNLTEFIKSYKHET